ncbi:MAG: hypothetical protein JWM57_3497 [Phycisphaerales bacterium]|nr:hypothetical protein [Phycisphaerales bacterium]
MRKFILTAAAIALTAHGAKAALPATQPTQVKLFVEAEDPREAAKQITRQLGIQVRLDPSAGVVQADSGGEKPFAAAVADLLKQGVLMPMGNSNRLTLTHGESYRLAPLGDSALLAISGVHLSAQHGMASGSDSYTYTYDLQGTVFLDPALKVVAILQDTRADRVEADVAVLPPDNGPGNSFYQMMNAMNGGDSIGRVAIRFASRTPITNIKSLAARLRAVQVVEEATADLSAEDMGSEKKIEGQAMSASMSVDNPDPRRATLSVRLSGPAIDKYRNGSWAQGMPRFVSAYDVNGDLLALDTMGWQPDGGKGVRLRFRPNNNPKFFDDLATLKVRLPMKVRTIDIPIELKDLELKTK